MNGARAGVVCLPTYDERENVEPVCLAILAAAPELDVLVIDDGSPDGTGEVADRLSAREPRVHVLHRARKEGLGKAYLAGFAWALERGYPLVLEMDADFSAFARGVVFGNPVFDQIRQRGGMEPTQIQEAVASAMRKEFGGEPGVMPIQAIVFEARKT
jgi:glycosyltransferase involved in cell wall biosynthesis